MDPGLIELFVNCKEDELPDAGRLDELGLGTGSEVFALFRPGCRQSPRGATAKMMLHRRVSVPRFCDGSGAKGRITAYDSSKSKSGECFVKWDGDGGTGWYSMIATSTLGGMLDRDLPFHFL